MSGSGAGSFFNGCRDFRVSGGEFYNIQGNMNTVSDGTSYTMSGSHNRPSNRNPGRGGFAPNQYSAPPNPQYSDPNARFPGYRPSAPNMGRSNTEPMMNTRYNPPQNTQYALANAPNFDADAALAEYLRNQANQRPNAPPLQSPFSPPQAQPRDRRGPAPQRPASMAIPVSSQSNSRGMNYSRDNISSSPEDVAPSSWSRPVSMSEFPQTWENDWSPQTPPNRSQFAPPAPANSSYRGSQFTPPAPANSSYRGSQFAPPAPANSSYRDRPRAHERRRGQARRSSSGSDSEDPDPPFSPPPPRPHPRRTSSQVVSSSPNSSWSAQQPGRPHRHNDADDSDSDSDGTAIMSGPSWTRQNSSRHPSTSTRVQQSPPINQFSPPAPSRLAYPQPSTSSRPPQPPPISNRQYPSSSPNTSSRSHGHRRRRPDDRSRAGSGSEDEVPGSYRRSNRASSPDASSER